MLLERVSSRRPRKFFWILTGLPPIVFRLWRGSCYSPFEAVELFFLNHLSTTAGMEP